MANDDVWGALFVLDGLGLLIWVAEGGKSVAWNRRLLGQTRTGTDGTTWQITIPGEAAHPGDAGMKFIADTLSLALDL